MEEEESSEGLNDLRKKRLAYFETLNHPGYKTEHQSTLNQIKDKIGNQFTPNGNLSEVLIQNQSTMNTENHSHTIDSHVADTANFQNGDLVNHSVPHSGKRFGLRESVNVRQNPQDTSYSSFTGDRHTNDEIKHSHFSTGSESEKVIDVEAQLVSKSRLRPAPEKDLNMKKHTLTNVDGKDVMAPDQVTLKTSSFYMTRPEHESHQKQTPKADLVPPVLLESDQNSDGLDAYNETVERLIRATKEEILGIKVSDNIWSNFSQEKKENIKLEADVKGNMFSKDNITESNLSAQNNLSNTHSGPVRRDFRRSMSESNSQEIAHRFHDRGVIHSEIPVKQREHRSSFSNTYDSKPLYSKEEPAKTVHHKPEEVKKSYNSAKIEEIFSSRQISHSKVPYNGFLKESVEELEPVREIVSDIVNNSADLSDLGLSTHRPESERSVDVKVAADDINLGDSVSKELRSLLGEEKFNLFLMKAKKDIDDLHQSSNENSARKDKTPRLLKDKPVKGNKPVAIAKEFKEEQPKSILKNHENVTMTEVMIKEEIRIRKISESNDSRTRLRDSADFTPRQTDAEAAENLIGEYLLTKQQPDSKTDKRLSTNTEFKHKDLDEKNTVEQNIKVNVPALDLGSVTKGESPRPKLNRPKYEPPTIYQEKLERNAEADKCLEREMKTGTSREMKMGTDKNYEQITVPRNVAFSADEIYNQAYGAFSPGQGPVASPPFHEGHMGHGPHGHIQRVSYHGPSTPSTPVAQVPFSFSHSDQLPSHSRRSHFVEGLNKFSPPPPYSMERQQIPHPPSQHGTPRNTPYSTVYASTPDFRGYIPANAQRFPAPEIPLTDQHSFHVPHPPPVSIPFSHGMSQANVTMPYQQTVPISHPYQHAAMMDPNMAAYGPGVYQSYAPTSTNGQIPKPDPPSSIGALVYQQGHAAPPPEARVREQKPSEPPPTPSMSNAEVQTDREETEVNEKVTLVEESTFTSVSQIVDDDKFVPHPPSAKKEVGPSPRRHHHKIDIAQKQANNSERHIEGIRQHHEQRRQQHEGEKNSDDKIVERQKKYAKASLDRYFSSMEDLYKPPIGVKSSDTHAEAAMAVIEDEDDITEVQAADDDLTEITHDVANDTVVEDVMSNVPNERGTVEPDHSAKSDKQYHPVVHGFIDFTETDEFVNANKNSESRTFQEGIDKQMHLSEKLNEEVDKETLVGTNVDTEVTIKGGGVTERLNDLGIDMTHLKHSETDVKTGVEKKKGDKKGKVLIVCPECQGLNKEYMSWCTQCGEMIIGVEPMLVSKNREGKLRMKPVSKEEILDHMDENVKNPFVKDVEKKGMSESHEVNYVQELDIEKPFTLNLEGIKSDKDEKDEVPELLENKKVSPIKSDGKDSGRPSSDDPDLDLQTQKIEEEVVNDICASISDPVLKGYVRSHFNKAKQPWHNNDKRGNRKDLTNGIEELDNHNLNNSKNFHTPTQHDVVYNLNKIDNVNNGDLFSENVEIQKRHKSDMDYEPERYKTYDFKTDKGVTKDKQKHLGKSRSRSQYDLIDSEEEVEVLFEPPPIPNFSSTLPISHNELALKLPANSMDYSTDMSQVVSHNFENNHEVNEKGDNVVDEEAAEERRLQKAERKKERRRKRGHGAIDVEVFGYEESRESRNSSRANRMVPMLNLGGNSSDEDDSVHSDFKPIKTDTKQEVKQKAGSTFQTKQSINAWEPPVIHEETYEDEDPLSWQQPIREEKNVIDESSELWRQPDKTLDDELKEYNTDFKTRTEVDNIEIERSLGIASAGMVEDIPREHTENSHNQKTTENEDWKQLFDPSLELEMEQEPVEVVEDDTEQGNQPFLMHLINHPKPEKTKKKPKSARGKTVRSKVRQSIEEPAYQRRWARSSTAWSSYNQGELNTSSSLRSSSDLTKARPSSAPKSRSNGSSAVYNSQASDDRDVKTSSSSRDFLLGKNRRPVSAPKARVSNHSLQPTDVGDQNHTEARGISPTRAASRLPARSVEMESTSHSNKKQSSFDNNMSSFNDGSNIATLSINLAGGHSRPASAPHAQSQEMDLQASCENDDGQGEMEDLDDLLDDQNENEVVAASSGKKTRPFSAETHKRKITKKKSKKSGNQGNSFDLELDLVNMMVEHRLPKPSAIDRLNEHMASPRSTYDKYIEMTPRIQAGSVSRWQCLPDEILLHIFSNLDQTSLTKCAQVCQQYYRVAMDESLWKYITIKKTEIDDSHLEEIARRHPVSLALLQCHGENVTAKGLRDLFRECSESIKELNISRCSRGALNGDSLLLHAAARCHNLTHIDASWCSLTDSGLMAISNCCHRLESLCINGCSAVSNDGLETVIKKHGTHLRVLEMFGCFNLSPRGLRSVANNCINLITLNLGQCYKLTDSCISQLSTSLGRVESLDLRGCKQIKDNCMRRVVKNCTRLKHLSLANCPSITDVSILEISTYLTDIRSLDLCGCKNVTDGSIRALVNTCSNLRHIDISSTSCTHRSVSMIANFSGQRLETLKINFLSDVTEQSLIKLARHCRRLKSIHMYGCPGVRNLDKVKEERPTFTVEM